jgi:hypothetical protein
MGLAVPTMYSIICETGGQTAMTVFNIVRPKAPRHKTFLVFTPRDLALTRTHCRWPLACQNSHCNLVALQPRMALPHPLPSAYFLCLRVSSHSEPGRKCLWDHPPFPPSQQFLPLPCGYHLPSPPLYRLRKVLFLLLHLESPILNRLPKKVSFLSVTFSVTFLGFIQFNITLLLFTFFLLLLPVWNLREWGEGEVQGRGP